MEKLFPFILFSVLTVSLAQADSPAVNDCTSSTIDIKTDYCNEEELSTRQSPCYLLENSGDWLIQFPSGSEGKGMISQRLTPTYKSKYFSAYESPDSKKYIRFSLDASDKGKSKNGSSVRVELRHTKEWPLSDKKSLSYTFFVTSTDLEKAKFTVGQFLQHCSKKDSPLCRIELENGKIIAVVVNYQSDGKTKADEKGHRYDLGRIQEKQEVSIKITIDNKILTLYRDGEKMAEHIFHKKVSSSLKNYFKLGIYYQNKDSPKIFSQVFVRDLKVED